MTDRELMQMALDALERCYDVTEWPANGKSAQDKAIEALRARLAQPEREWQGLTDEEIEALNCTTINASDWNEYEVYKPSVQEFARAIEAKLKEKNGY